MALVEKIVDSWRDNFKVGRVFGDPIEKDGFTVIPVAMVVGGGGGGSGPMSETDPAEGGGGGFGGLARPAGVYVMSEDGVSWRPALDITLLGLAGIALLTLITKVVGRAMARRR